MRRIFLISLMALAFSNSFGQVRNPLDDGRKIRIPVVFHVIYGNTVENIPDSMILKELNDLNLDFSAMNDMSLLDGDFRSIVGNPNIEFYLLDTSLQDAGMKAVRRIRTRDAKDRDALLIAPANCLNVFIANHGNSTSGNEDRVNLYYEDIGTNTHGSTHETGHWLGLYHTFGKMINTAWWRVIVGDHDDEIGDTPEQRKGSATCYTITSDCPCPPDNIYYDGHKTLYNNFMDYNPCRCMFTVGQAIQMRNTIIEDRPGLFN